MRTKLLLTLFIPLIIGLIVGYSSSQILAKSESPLTTNGPTYQRNRFFANEKALFQGKVLAANGKSFFVQNIKGELGILKLSSNLKIEHSTGSSEIASTSALLNKLPYNRDIQIFLKLSNNTYSVETIKYPALGE